MFALVDCNNFYASCERLFRPDLRGKPVVVLSNNDGCVIARSNEAKKLGIPMGAPAFEYEPLFVRYGVAVFSANFALYGDLSNRVMTILSMYSPDIEIYSIDEAFLKWDNMGYIELQAYAQQIRQQVSQWVGIPISIGIAPTKALAKVANKIVKKYPERTQGVYMIDNEEKRIKALKWLPVEDVWGIGRQHSRRLYEQNVHKAYDFIQLSDAWVQKNMSVVGLRLKRDLQGIPTLNLEEVQAKKNIATTRSFEENYRELGQVRERVVSFAVACAEKLRRQSSCCQSMMVFIHTNGFRKDQPQYSRNIVIKLPFPTNSGIELAKFAAQGLEQIFKPGYLYKKAGVIVQDFVAENQWQLSLFSNRSEKQVPLMRALDMLNRRYGQQKIRLASQDQQRLWKMKQQKLSPRYTTRLSDIITIKL